ncbi:restriction endonuclease subunit S [Kroppenstedtia sanguinis]|uniref:Restriction endonuclease subunit S n=1 Tax=Kroppenstedtia sanguinis TaxID=1380684 RepID=A0ABW4CB26_9BACL
MGQSPKGEFTTDSPDGSVPLVGGPADMGADYPNVTRYTRKPTRLSEINDLIISIRATLGKTNFSNGRYCLGRGVAGISSMNVNLKLLRYYFNVNEQYLYEVSSGTTFSQIARNDLSNLPFPLPPLSEQKRIVDRVESLLGKIDEAKGLIQEAQESFEQRRAALLDRAFRGELTRTWREQHPDMEPADRLLERIREEKASMEIQKGRRKKAADLSPIDPPYELPEGWKWVRLGELTESTGYGTSAKANDDTTGVPVLRMGNIQHGELESDNLRYLPPDHPDVQKYQLEEDDLLFNRTNSYELVGKTAIVRAQQAGKMTYASYLVRVRLHKKNVLAQYICNYINSAIGREYLLSTVTQQVGQANINASKLIGLPVPVPPEDELKEIKSTLESIFVLAEQADEYLEVNLSTLIQSILTQAFRGELGTHDPAEESALELLKRTLADQNGLDYESPVRETLQVAEQGELYLT